MLTDMGIEVWRRRSEPAGIEVKAESAHALASAAASGSPPHTTGSRSVRAGALAEEVVPDDTTAVMAMAEASTTHARSTHATTLDLAVLSAPGIVVVGPDDEPADRKIMQGIMLAVTTQQPRHARFLWPQPGYRDSSEVALERAYTAFLQGQTRRAQARVVVLMSSMAQRTPTDAIDGAPVIGSPSAAELRIDPAGKRSLWMKLARHLKKS